MAGAYGKNKREVKAKLAQRGLQRARGAWLIASDLASGLNPSAAVDVRVVLRSRGTVGRGSDATTARARKIACWLAVTVANCRATELAAAAGLDAATIREHVGWVEDRLDEDLALTREVKGLETRMIETVTLIAMAALCLDQPEPEAA